MLKKGDPVTVLRATVEGQLVPVYGIVDGVNEILPYFTTAAAGVSFYLSEGTYWIRGHHAEGSDAVRALLATAALSS